MAETGGFSEARRTSVPIVGGGEPMYIMNVNKCIQNLKQSPAGSAVSTNRI